MELNSEHLHDSPDSQTDFSLRQLYKNVEMCPYPLTEDDLNAKPPRLRFATAYELILHIANKPIAARYIEHADFAWDSRIFVDFNKQVVKNVCDRIGPWDPKGAVSQLLQNSSYLKEAELDWKEFYELTIQDAKYRRYSPCATAFLCTLLPNLETLSWPIYWDFRRMSSSRRKVCQKLMERIVRKAVHPSSSGDCSSLAQLATLSYSFREMCTALPIFCLPSLSKLELTHCDMLGNIRTTVMISSRFHVWKNLRTLEMKRACFEQINVCQLLRHLPSLERLSYEHRSKLHGSPEEAGRKMYDSAVKSAAEQGSEVSGSAPQQAMASIPNDHEPEEWDIYDFLVIIRQEVGAHLVELSIINSDSLTIIMKGGHVTLRDFQQLRKLRLSLDVVECNLDAAADAISLPKLLEQPESCSIGDLAPSTVSIFSLVSISNKKQTDVLERMLRDFENIRTKYWPALETLELFQLALPSGKDDENYWTDFVEEHSQALMIVNLTGWPMSHGLAWPQDPLGSLGGYHFRPNSSADQESHEGNQISPSARCSNGLQ